jgi:hypothetical protein
MTNNKESASKVEIQSDKDARVIARTMEGRGPTNVLDFDPTRALKKRVAVRTLHFIDEVRCVHCGCIQAAEGTYCIACGELRA